MTGTITLLAILAAAPLTFLALSRLHGALQRPPQRPPQRGTVSAGNPVRKRGWGA